MIAPPQRRSLSSVPPRSHQKRQAGPEAGDGVIFASLIDCTQHYGHCLMSEDSGVGEVEQSYPLDQQLCLPTCFTA